MRGNFQAASTFHPGEAPGCFTFALSKTIPTRPAAYPGIAVTGCATDGRCIVAFYIQRRHRNLYYSATVRVQTRHSPPKRLAGKVKCVTNCSNLHERKLSVAADAAARRIQCLFQPVQTRTPAPEFQHILFLTSVDCRE